jgi:two-component system, NtrC family, response regulator AlgB
MAKLLIVDRDKNVRNTLANYLRNAGHQIEVAEGGKQALEMIAAADCDIVLTDYRPTDSKDAELLREISRRCPNLLVILMTAYETAEAAISAMKEGAFDYVTKPFSLDQLEHVLKRALEFRRLQDENRVLRDALDRWPLLESRSPVMQRLLESAQRAATSDATILLVGESGSGKSLLASRIHRWSRRGERSFVTVNCSTISEHLLESELLGHVRGSFTGATKDKPGRLEAAEGGTLFIDEIAELHAGLQTKLLRFVQEHAFERVGGDNTIKVDVRIIAASNRDLASEVAARRFREDLFYRLNVITLRVPPLREHAVDILPLANRILAGIATANHRPELHWSPEACDTLTRYSWPGNIRELRNAIERASLLCRGDEITAEHLPDTLFRAPDASAATPAASSSLEETELEHIRGVLEESPTLEDAAVALGISPSTLWRKRKRYGLDERIRTRN